MSWVATAISVTAGVGGTLANQAHSKSMAKAQARLSQEQAQKLRDRAAVAGQATEREIANMRTLRAMDLPAFRQAGENAMLRAQQGVERLARARAIGRTSGEVRQAIFGEQFQQYIGREYQRLQQYAGLTEQILQATERQQERALNLEAQAGQLEYAGQSQAIQMQAEAGSALGSILGAVGQAASVYAQSTQASAAQADKTAQAQASENKWLEFAYAEAGIPMPGAAAATPEPFRIKISSGNMFNATGGKIPGQVNY
jgi:excinuclease UvrABC nuclease subunit